MSMAGTYRRAYACNLDGMREFHCDLCIQRNLIELVRVIEGEDNGTYLDEQRNP